MNELVKRHIKIYFKDKVGFFLSLISPLILLVLFITFLKNVYEQSLINSLPESVTLSREVLNGFTGGWLISSILGVSCVTVAFCSNTIMVNDRIENCISDFYITPIKKYKIAISYFISNYISTFIVCFTLLCVGLLYLALVGWHLSFIDVIGIIGILILNVGFGCLLSNIVLGFIKTQGGESAVVTLISSMYGFLCGAYMPISQFALSIKTIVGMIPGTYTTVLFRRYFMNGCLEKINQVTSNEVINGLRDAFDTNLYAFNHLFTSGEMYLVIVTSLVAMFGICISLIYYQNRQKKTGDLND